MLVLVQLPFRTKADNPTEALLFRRSAKLPGMHVDHEGRQARFRVANEVPLTGFSIGMFAFALQNFSGETVSIISEADRQNGEVVSIRLRFLLEVPNTNVAALEERLAQRKLPDLMVNVPFDVNEPPDVLYVVDNKLPRVVFDPQQVFTLTMLHRWISELQSATGMAFEFTLHEGYPALCTSIGNDSRDDVQSLSLVAAELWQPARYACLATMFGDLLFSDERLAYGSRVVIDLRGCAPTPKLMQAIGVYASVSTKQISGTSIEAISHDRDPNRLFRLLSDTLKQQGIHPIGPIQFQMGPHEKREYGLVLTSRLAPQPVQAVLPVTAVPPTPQLSAEGTVNSDEGDKPTT